MDTALQNAILAKARITAEIQSLQDRLRQIEAFIALYDEFVQGNEPSAAPKMVVLPPLPLPPLKRKSIADHVAEILEDGRPRTTGVLVDMLKSRGIQIGGEKKIVNLSSLLSRDPRFASDRVQGWALRMPEKVNPSSAPTDKGLF